MSQNKPKAELLSPGAVIFYFRFPKYFDSPHTGPCKINGSCCGSTYTLSLRLAPPSQLKEGSVSAFSCSQRTPSHPTAGSSWVQLSASQLSNSSIPWKKARRITFTWWRGHLPKWTDFHHFLCNPHFELVLNFSDQVEKRSEGSCLRSPRAWSVSTSLLLWI